MVTEKINNGLIYDAITQLRDCAIKYPGEGFIDRIEAIATDFEYMSSFMLKGVKDEHRGELYAALTQKLHDLDYDLEVRRTIWEQPEIAIYRNILLDPDSTTEVVQEVLLTPQEAKEHFAHLATAFIMLYASLHWKDEDATRWATFLCKENINPIDAAALVSAITLNLLEHYNAPKVRCLKEVYNNSSLTIVKQRALVALVMLGEEISIETHIQMVACANADKDSNEIRKNIMPEIIKNQPFTMVNGKWKMNDSDDPTPPGEYDPNSDKREEENIEMMERSVNKMLKMQKKGSDIFFEGFSQMKRFPFFGKTINWFIPYYPEHPEIETIINNIGNSSFIDIVMKRGPFCESDKYSFLIAMSSVIKQLPDNVRKLMESGEMGPIGMRSADANLDDPALIKLQCLQDMYRYFRLNSIGIRAYNPFNHIDDILEKFIEKAAKEEEQSQTDTAKENSTDYTNLYAYYANWKMKNGDSKTALEYYTKCLKYKPKSISIMQGLAKANYLLGNYDESASYFDALITINPDNLNNRLNYAKAMAKAGKAEQVLNDLYKLEFENPDNHSIQDTLGWVLLYAGKAAEAEQYCFDVIPRAYALLINSKPNEAVEILKKYPIEQIRENMNADAQMLQTYGIGEAEIAIILSAIQQSNVP